MSGLEETKVVKPASTGELDKDVATMMDLYESMMINMVKRTPRSASCEMR